MHFSFTLDVEDWMEFQKHFLLTSRMFKRTRVMLTWLLPLVILFLFFKDFDASQMSASYATPYIVMALVAGAWMVFFPNFYFNRVLSQARKLAERGEHNDILGDREITVDEAVGVSQKFNGEVFEVGWDDIVRIDQTDNYYYLFNTKMSAVIVPVLKIKSSPNHAALIALLDERKKEYIPA